MEKKTASAIMLTLLLTSMLTLAFKIQPVKASGTIYIRADGSIDPPTAPIYTADNTTYTLTGNITSNADGIVIERDNMTLDGAGYTLQGTTGEESKGIYLTGRSNVTIKNMKITAFWDGILLSSSSNNSVSGNNITANNYYGIYLEYSSDNSIVGNKITNNYNEAGIVVYESSNNTISGNDIANNGYGMALVDSSGNSISGNDIANSGYGIWLDSSSGNSISGNTFTNDGLCVRLDSSSNNSIYHNNFVNNTQQVYSDGSINVWDDGYPSGGNYWSDYNGTDSYRGLHQNETGSDGIGDTPYIIDENNQDNCPLMKPYPWSSHDIGITGITTSKTVVGQGFNLNINITIFNYGDNTETFNVTVYCNETTITLPNEENYTTVTLASGESTTVVIAWNTSGFAKGNYTISAVVDTVPGETYTADNTFKDGTVLVTILGDVNGDRKVDMKDIVQLILHYNSKEGQPGYVANCDINGDGSIDMKDIVIAILHFNQT